MHEIWLDANDDIWLVDPTEPDIFHGTLANDGWKHRKEFDVEPRRLIVKEQANDKDAQYIYRAKWIGQGKYRRDNSKFYESMGRAKAYRTLQGGIHNPEYVIQRAELDWETVA